MTASTVLKSCFVISPIGEDGSQTRHRSDQVLKHIIRPAAREAGYEAKRADEIDKPGLITSQVIQCVISDQLVIADLTGMNPNVFYELAIRHAIRKPLVQLIQKGERIPFDVAGTRTIHVDHQDLDSVDAAKQQIVAQIRELEASPEDIETPISVSMDLQILRQSENPEDRSIAEMLSEISDVKAAIVKIEEKLESPDLSKISEAVKHLEYLLRETSLKRRDPLSDSKSSRMMMHFVEDVHSDRPDSLPIAVLVVSSLFRDVAPWLFVAGEVLYQRLNGGSRERVRKPLEQFLHIADITIHHPAIRDSMEMRHEERYFMLRKLLDRLVARLHRELG